MRATPFWQPLIASKAERPKRSIQQLQSCPRQLSFGAEWNYRGPIAGLDLNLPLKIVGDGDIEVPAGKFRALHFRGRKK